MPKMNSQWFIADASKFAESVKTLARNRESEPCSSLAEARVANELADGETIMVQVPIGAISGQKKIETMTVVSKDFTVVEKDFEFGDK